METIGSISRNPAEAHPLTVAAIGFNHRRAAERTNDLCAALLAIATHDLRQPLQIIIGAHDLLAKTLGGSIEQVQLARAETAASRLSEQLDEIGGALRLFQMASGGAQELVRLGPIFALFAAEFAEAARLKGVRLRLVPTHAVVSSNTMLLCGILRNLIRNALEYTPRGGRVLVAARRRGATVHLEVRDSGIGISARDLGDIFKPFRRVDTTRADGLGLGLFIVKCATAFLGHRIEVSSVLGRGSRFVVVANNCPLLSARVPRNDPQHPNSDAGLARESSRQ